MKSRDQFLPIIDILVEELQHSKEEWMRVLEEYDDIWLHDLAWSMTLPDLLKFYEAVKKRGD